MAEEIHYNNGGRYECDSTLNVNFNVMTMVDTKLTCIKCVNLVLQEWKEQVKTFSGQPLINAKVGVKRVQNHLKELKNKAGEGQKVKEE